jgi:hypothetical protein
LARFSLAATAASCNSLIKRSFSVLSITASPFPGWCLTATGGSDRLPLRVDVETKDNKQTGLRRLAPNAVGKVPTDSSRVPSPAMGLVRERVCPARPAPSCLQTKKRRETLRPRAPVPA